MQFDCDALVLGLAVFRDCPLGELELGNNILEIQDCSFEGTDLTTLTLPPSVTRITYRSFAFNPNLVIVTIPDTVKDINPYAFEHDTNLSHVLYTGTQNQWNALDVQSAEINQATLHCGAMGNEVTVEQDCTHVRFFCTICDKWEAVKKKNAGHSFKNGVCAVCGQEGYWEYVVDEEAGEVTVIGYVGNEADVVIPDELDGLPVTAFTVETFAYSRKLRSVTIPGTVAEVYSGAFRECKYLEAVTVESGVTTIGSYAFYECRNLKNVVLPDTVTTIGEYAFYNNSFDQFQMPEMLTTVGAFAFCGCSSLRAVILPEGVTTIGDSAFHYCYDLSEMTIPRSVTTIGDSAFYYCYSLNEVIIPEGVTEIGRDAFKRCYLDKVQLPETLITIGENAFAFHDFKTVVIPASVKTIGAGAFDPREDAFESVKFLGEKPSMDDAFEYCLTAFYDPTLPGWEEYLANYEGNIVWYAANAPEIRVQPQDTTVKSGSTATVCAEGYGHRLSYQWYCAPYGSDTFTAVGGNCFELSMVMDTTNPNVRAYCVISDVLGRTTTTETVTLKIDAEPIGIRINRMPDLVEYDLHQELRTDGLEIVLIYSDSTEAPIDDYKISGYQPNVAGEQVVVVSYGVHTAYFSVTVNAEKLHFTDKQQGVEISAPKDALDSDTVLTVETVELPEIPELFKDKATLSYNITLQAGGQMVRPRDEVKVLIPVPENMNGKRCRIYRVDEQGTIEDMNAVPVGKYLEFYTSCLGLYSIVELPGYTVSGSIASPAGTQTVTVKLLCNGRVVQSQQSTEGAYCFNDVTDGSYTLEVNADGGKVRSYVITVMGAAVYQNLSVVEYTVTFLDWDASIITSQMYFEGSLVTAPADPVRQNDRTYSYTFTGWDQKILPCTEDAVYTATYSYHYLNEGGSITVGSTVASVGEQLALPVSVSDNVGIAGLKHTLTFDAAAVKFIGVEFQGDFAQGSSIVNDSKADQGLLSVLWFHNHDVVSDGIIYNLIFEVLETATNEKTEVTVEFNVDGNANSVGENVIFDRVNGTVETRTYWLGDLNGDRKFAMLDLVMLAQYVAGFEMPLTEQQLLSADVNEDGSIDIHDVVLLNQWLLAEDI